MIYFNSDYFYWGQLDVQPRCPVNSHIIGQIKFPTSELSLQLHHWMQRCCLDTATIWLLAACWWRAVVRGTLCSRSISCSCKQWRKAGNRVIKSNIKWRISHTSPLEISSSARIVSLLHANKFSLCEETMPEVLKQLSPFRSGISEGVMWPQRWFRKLNRKIFFWPSAVFLTAVLLCVEWKELGIY